MVYLLTETKTQTQDVSNSYLLTAQTDLENRAKLFLLASKVDGLSPSTLRDYSYQIGRFIKFMQSQGSIDVPVVTVNHVRLFISYLQETNNSVSVSDYYKSLHRFFNWLVAEEIIDKNPMEKLHPPRVTRKVIQPFTTQHIEQMLSLCNNRFMGLRNRAIILTFLDTGLRLAELASIQVADIDFDREIIKVMGKGARERIVRIGKRTQKALLKYLLTRGSNLPGLWVTEEKKPLAAEGIAEIFKKRMKATGKFNDVRCSPHTFRHTFATSALRNGADVRDVQSLLGHSSLKMTMRYVATVGSEQAVERHKKWSPVDVMNIK